MLSVRLPGFIPSVAGFAFDNNTLVPPQIEFNLPGGSMLQLSDVVRGLGGGMAFAAADYWQAGRRPGNGRAPQPGTLMYGYLLQRQAANLDPAMLTLVVTAMHPAVPDATPGDAYTQAYGLSRAAIMVAYQWPAVQRDLDNQVPSQLTMIEAISPDPRALGLHNRQVLCYGYDYEPATGWCTLWIYDPAAPKRDDVRLVLRVADPTVPNYPVYTGATTQPRCFFRVPYSPAVPPP